MIWTTDPFSSETEYYMYVWLTDLTKKYEIQASLVLLNLCSAVSEWLYGYYV